MTKDELYSAIQMKYHDPDFISDLKQDTTGTAQILCKMMNAGEDKAAWQEIEKLFDEYTYFALYDDDTIGFETL